MNLSAPVQFLFLLFFCISCSGIGLVCFRLLGWHFNHDSSLSPINILASALLFGQGMLAILLNILGTFSLFLPVILWAILISGAAIAILLGMPLRRHLASRLQKLVSVFKSMGPLWKIIAGLIVISIIPIAIACIVSPVAVDAANVYLSESKLIANTHQITPIPLLGLYLQQGLVGEVIFALFLALGIGTETARLFVLVLFLAMTVIFANLGHEVGIKRNGQLILIAIAFTSSALTNFISNCKVDFFAAALGILAFFWAARVQEKNPYSAPMLRLAALAGSMSVVAKSTYVVCLIFPLGIFILWRQWFDIKAVKPIEKIKKVFICGLQLGLWMLAAQIPHFIKNAVIFHEPLAPFIGQTGASWLSNSWMSAESIKRLLAVYPFALTFGNYPGPVFQWGRLSFLVLAFIPLAFLLPRQKALTSNILFQITGCALVGMVLWTLIWPSIFVTRYFAATILLFGLPAARAAENILDHAKSFSRLDIGISFITFAALLLSIFYQISDFPTSETPGENWQNVLSSFFSKKPLPSCSWNQYDCRSFTLLNQQAKSGTRIYQTSTTSSYFLRNDLTQCLRTENDPSLITGQVEKNWDNLLRYGFEYIIIYTRSPDANQALGIPDHLPNSIILKNIFKRGIYTVYSIKNNNKNIVPAVSCQQIQTGVWKVVPNSAAQP